MRLVFGDYYLRLIGFFDEKPVPWRDDAFLRAAAPELRPLRPCPACGRAGVPPSPRISARSLFASLIPPYKRRRFFSPRPAPRLRLWAPLPALRPPQAPVSALARGHRPRAFCLLSHLVAPSLRYRASCRASKVTVISHICRCFCKCLRRTFFHLRYHIIFTIICYN